MDITIMPEAEVTLLGLSSFKDSINIIGSGEKYLDKLFTFIEKYAQPNVEYKKCLDERLETLKYSCLNFDNWVIAFKIENENFNIYEIIWGPILK